MKKTIIYWVLSFTILLGCSKSDNITQNSNGGGGTNGNTGGGNSNTNSWLIPVDEVVDGGPGKDGIPSIDNPKFISATSPDSDYLYDNDLVIGIVIDDVPKAYPHVILDWHEAVNDNIDDKYFTINYCPLTGTAFSWERKINQETSTFGVSGLLYNSNLILYDRATDSNWSQLRLECVNGELIGDKVVTNPIIETTWETWKKMYPGTKVLSLDTGFPRNYGAYPYGGYQTDHDFLLFPVSPLNEELPSKERVYAIIEQGQTMVYQFSKFSEGKALKNTFMSKEYLVVGNEEVINAFELNGEYLNLDFDYGFNNSESFFKDNEGNTWSIFGKAIEGPRTGQSLSPAASVVSYWFAIAAFYPNPLIYSE